MTLRPGHAPARLLLALWAKQARGLRQTRLDSSPALSRLLALQFVGLTYSHADIYSLTPAGRLAAQAWATGAR